MQDKLHTKIVPTKDSVIFKFSVPEDYLKNDTLRTTWKDISGNVEDSSVLKDYLDSNLNNSYLFNQQYCFVGKHIHTPQLF